MLLKDPDFSYDAEGYCFAGLEDDLVVAGANNGNISFGHSPMKDDAIAPSTDPFRTFVMAMTEESIASVAAMTNRRLLHVVTTE